MKISVLVAKMTPSSNGGNIVTLLTKEKVKSALGMKEIEKKLFYKAVESDIKVGDVIEIETNDFNFVTSIQNFEGRNTSMTWIKEKTQVSSVTNDAFVMDNRATVVSSVANF